MKLKSLSIISETLAWLERLQMRHCHWKFLVMILVCLTATISLSQQALPIGHKISAPETTPLLKKINKAGFVVDAIQTTDGGFLSLSRKYGDTKYILRKSDASGQRQWEKALHLPFSNFVFFSSIAQTNDGYVLVGAGGGLVGYYYGLSSAVIVALNSTGAIKWKKSFRASNRRLLFHLVKADPDGGSTVTGYADPTGCPVLIKFSSVGDILWAKAFDSLSHSFRSVGLSDNAILLASDIFDANFQVIGENLIKVNSSGHIVWRKIFETNEFSTPVLGSTLEDGILIASGVPGSKAFVLIGLDSRGRLIWNAKYSLNLPNFFLSRVIQTPDKGFALTGSTYNLPGRILDGIFLKIDSQQNLLLTKRLGHSRVRDEASRVFAHHDGSYVVFGSTKNDMFFLRLNSHGIIPGCNFAHDFGSKRLPTASVFIKNTTITAVKLSLLPAKDVQIASADSSLRTSTSCN